MKIVIHLDEQRLHLLSPEGETATTYLISSGKNGIGQQMGSEKTPQGPHRICEKIGDELPLNAVLKGRCWTQEIYSPELAKLHPGRDWILTRILWLEGLEPGFNQGGEVDTRARYIYIHGTPDASPMGEPASHGCIRMHNHDLLDLYHQVSVGTQVDIL